MQNDQPNCRILQFPTPPERDERIKEGRSSAYDAKLARVNKLFDRLEAAETEQDLEGYSPKEIKLWHLFNNMGKKD